MLLVHLRAADCPRIQRPPLPPPALLPPPHPQRRRSSTPRPAPFVGEPSSPTPPQSRRPRDPSDPGRSDSEAGEPLVLGAGMLLVHLRAADRWERVAAVLPGRTVADVTAHYDDLEWAAGFTFEWDGDAGGTGFKRSCHVVGGGKRERGPDHERKKGIPWTKEEHK
eukprot:XP_020400263.1 uncharacterized protein LOC109942578 [Zea mays]